MDPTKTAKEQGRVLSLTAIAAIVAGVAVLATVVCAWQMGYLLGHAPNAAVHQPAPAPQTAPASPAIALASQPAQISQPAPSSQPSSASQPSSVAQFLSDHGLLGKVALLHFGGVSCSWADQELDAMISLYNRKAVPGLSYARVEVGIDAKEAAAYYAKKQIPFPVIQDENDAAAKAFDCAKYPGFVLVDKFGRIRYRGVNLNRSDLYNWVEALSSESSDQGSDVALFGEQQLDVPKLLASTQLPDLKQLVRPLNEYRGENGLMLVFVDTNCPFAGTAIGETSTVSAVLGGRKVRTVMINLNDPQDTVGEFYKTHFTGTPVVFDVGTGTQLRWNVDMVPTVMVVSAADKVVYNGPAVWADVGAAAAEMLGLPASQVQLGAQGTGQG